MIKLLCAAAAIAVLGSSGMAAQGNAPFKIGFVSAETILKELPEAQTANKALEDWGRKVQDTLAMMQKEFETRLEAYQKQEAMLTADNKRKEQESLQALRMRYGQYQEEKVGAQGELARLRESYLAPIRDKIQAAVAVVAKEEKCSAILEKLNGIVLYSDDKLDLTFKVLDKLKRGDK